MLIGHFLVGGKATEAEQGKNVMALPGTIPSDLYRNDFHIPCCNTHGSVFCGAMSTGFQLFRYLVTFLQALFLPRGALATRLLVAESQVPPAPARGPGVTEFFRQTMADWPVNARFISRGAQ